MPYDESAAALLAEHIALDDAAQALLFTEARSANTFTDEPVSSEQLRAIWELAKFPPTAANTNPLRVLYVSSPDARVRLVDLMNEGNKAKTAAAPAVAILAADLDFHEHIPQLFPSRPELRDVFAADDEARAAHARVNATLQIGYYLLAVRAAGLAAGPMGGFDAAGVDAEFFSGGRCGRCWSSTSASRARTRGSTACRVWITSRRCASSSAGWPPRAPRRMRRRGFPRGLAGIPDRVCASRTGTAARPTAPAHARCVGQRCATRGFSHR